MGAAVRQVSAVRPDSPARAPSAEPRPSVKVAAWASSSGCRMFLYRRGFDRQKRREWFRETDEGPRRHGQPAEGEHLPGGRAYLRTHGGPRPRRVRIPLAPGREPPAVPGVRRLRREGRGALPEPGRSAGDRAADGRGRRGRPRIAGLLLGRLGPVQGLHRPAQVHDAPPAVPREEGPRSRDRHVRHAGGPGLPRESGAVLGLRGCGKRRLVTPPMVPARQQEKNEQILASAADSFSRALRAGRTSPRPREVVMFHGACAYRRAAGRDPGRLPVQERTGLARARCPVLRRHAGQPRQNRGRPAMVGGVHPCSRTTTEASGSNGLVRTASEKRYG